MAGIPAINPYSGIYAISKLYGGRAVDAVNGANPQWRNIDNLTANVRSLTAMSRQDIKSQQQRFREQVKEFGASSHELYRAANAVKRMSAGQSADKTVQDVTKAIDSYNRLTTVLSKADNLTPRGGALGAGLEAVAAGREKALNGLGIARNASTGEWTVDEAKLRQELAADRQRVQEILGGEKGFGAAVSAAVEPAVREPSGDYLTSPAKAQIQGNGQFRQRSGQFSVGLLLDLLA
jgi:hypothetical protein